MPSISKIKINGTEYEIAGGGSGSVTGVKGNKESTYRTGNVNLTPANIGALPDTTPIPSKTSDLTNDSNFVSDANYVHTDNNYTTTEKNKLANAVEDNPTFTEASTRTNIASGESISTLFGKIKKWFTDLKTVAFSGSYNDLTNKPTIPTVNNGTLTIQRNGTNVQTFTANQSSNATANITVPTKTSELTNNSNYVSDASYVHTDNNYTTTEKNKLSGIAPGAEINQNAFSNVKVGSTTIQADSKTDTLELVAGSNITLTPDASGNKVTIASSGGGGGSSPDVLWTNPNGFSPGSFAAQYIDVGVNLENYRWYEITFNVTDSASNPKASSTGLIPVGSGCNLQRTGGTYLISRGLDAPTIVMTSSGMATRFNFTACTRINSYGASGSTNYNQLCIPYQIIGYR